MKKTLALVAVMMLVVSTLLGCGGTATTGTKAEETKAEETKAEDTKAEETKAEEGSDIDYSGTITFACGGTESKGLELVLAAYQEQHPDVDLDIILCETVTDFETNMATWIAADTLPDMYFAQVGVVEQQFAKEGLLLPIPDSITANLMAGDTSLITVDGTYYAFPMTTSVSVTLCNNAKLKELGIELTKDNYPTCMDEYIDLLQQVRDAGVEYPYGIAGADLSSCTAWPFQYMYQVLYGENPNWYADVLKGEHSWSDPEFVSMFEDYGRITEYLSPDSLGKTMDGVYADFIAGDTVFFSQVASTIKSVKALDPEMDIILIPASFNKKSEDQTCIGGFDSAVSVTKGAKNPDLCFDFMSFLCSPEGSTLMCNETGWIPTVIGCEAEIDPSYEIVFDIMQNGTLPNCPILSRQWIAGFKELLKSGCQNWLAGEEPQSVADTIAEEHTRLMDASPDWVSEWLAGYQYK